ncbi:single-stranded DNA-binding protein [Microbacterium jejuense]|uniref:Single-stranded DNA-binding protein n=1 Tax=Microbacterium jejuense TaxID=1263637 RepID=A0ABS7HJ63_9MICO|nr:single-stranded DNA-binding protein [Microbacterium jejuense]MBW9092853.1 single-stranded DNA-binding protein [Microbacterium jejuense]
MSDLYDSITVTGNVATEPEFKRTQNGLGITSFRVASGQRRFDRQTERWIDAGTNWYTVSVFRGLADHAFASLHKGDRVILTGRLRQREWDNGEKRGTSLDIEADALGHDLLWGTTTFVKDDRRHSADPIPPDAWRAPDATRAWAAPGVEAEPAADAVEPMALEPTGGELVGAGAGASDAPF